MTAVTEKKTKFVLHPLKGRVLVQEDSFSYTGKLVIPEAAKRRPSTGHVVEIGPDTDAGVKIGDRVLYPMYSGTGVRFRDKNTQENLPPMRVLTPEEILCIIEGEADLEEAGA